MKIIKLKVFTNSRNGQGVVHLPKKVFVKMPQNIKIQVPKENVKPKWKKIKW